MSAWDPTAQRRRIIADAPAWAVAYHHNTPVSDARYLDDEAEADAIEADDPSLVVWLDGRDER